MRDFTSNRRAEAAQLLAECRAHEIRVWMSRGQVHASLANNDPVLEPWRSRLLAFCPEIAGLIGYGGQRLVHATELRDGCRVYWLREAIPADPASTGGHAA